MVLETEFNTQGIEDYEPFDAMLAEQAHLFRSRANVRVVLGFGNWGSEKWARFGSAAAASDMVGTQLLRSSVRESGRPYLSAADSLVNGARTLSSRFGKPVLIMDVALSTLPPSSAPPWSTASRPAHCNLVVDLQAVTYIDSSGLGALVSALKLLKTGRDRRARPREERSRRPAARGDIRLAAAQPPVVSLLKIIRLNRVFATYATVAEAADSFD